MSPASVQKANNDNYNHNNEKPARTILAKSTY